MVDQENNFSNKNGVFSKRVRAGKRRTYFIDVRTTRSNDYFLTLTESKKRFDDNGYERHKLHLYKEDFNKFIQALEETIDFVKTELMPDFDFDAFSHQNDFDYDENGNYIGSANQQNSEPQNSEDIEEEDSEDLADEE